MNDKVLFKMEIDGELEAIIKGEGTVKWIRHKEKDQSPAGCGVEFISFEGSGKINLFEYINFLKTRQYIPRF